MYSESGQISDSLIAWELDITQIVLQNLGTRLMLLVIDNVITLQLYMYVYWPQFS